MPDSKQILTKEAAEKKLRRIAFEIIERNASEEYLLLAGIRENGFIIASILKEMIEPVFKGKVELTGIRVDKKNPLDITLDPQSGLSKKAVILVDDVANSGKTMLYALKPFLEEYPKKIQTVVLVERTHKAFPVNPDYKGLSIATTLQEHIRVEVEDGKVSGAWLS